MNFTKNIGLSQWDLTDKPTMADFNADNKRIDAAVGQLNTDKVGKNGTERIIISGDNRPLKIVAAGGNAADILFLNNVFYIRFFENDTTLKASIGITASGTINITGTKLLFNGVPIA